MRRVRIRQGEGHADGVLTDEGVELADGSRIDPADADWLAPVEPSKIVATHLSYRSRCDEYPMAAPPQYPSYFLKPPSSLSAHEAEVARPRGCRFLNYEGEIAVVIGTRCRGVSRAEALDHVAGYTVANDFGVHDFRHIDRGSMLRVKGQDGFCPLGPAVVDAADVDPEALVVRTFVNGEQVQEGDGRRPAVRLRLPGRRRLAADHARARRRAAHRHAGELAPGRARATWSRWRSRASAGCATGSSSSTATSRTSARPPEVSAQTLHVALAMPEDEAEREVAEGEVTS